jgi:hypothetical protein
VKDWESIMLIPMFRIRLNITNLARKINYECLSLGGPLKVGGLPSRLADTLHSLFIFSGQRVPEGKRPLVRHGLRWIDNITVDLRETGREFVDWIHLNQDRY